MQTVLVVVHPGSALGSANFNLGKFEARAARDELAQELEEWNGPMLVIHGELSDELPYYPRLNQAIEEAVERNKAAGFRSQQVRGCDSEEYNQENAVEDWVAEVGFNATDTDFEVTGAWYHPEDGSGCVGGVIEHLKALGYSAQVSPSAMELCFEEEPNEDLDEEPEVAPAPVTLQRKKPRP